VHGLVWCHLQQYTTDCICRAVPSLKGTFAWSNRSLSLFSIKRVWLVIYGTSRQCRSTAGQAQRTPLICRSTQVLAAPCLHSKHVDDASHAARTPSGPKLSS